MPEAHAVGLVQVTSDRLHLRGGDSQFTRNGSTGLKPAIVQPKRENSWSVDDKSGFGFRPL